jgi:hypothetical protein
LLREIPKIPFRVTMGEVVLSAAEEGAEESGVTSTPR